MDFYRWLDLKIPFNQFRNIVILTGAGVSVASGLKPFRGFGGIWEEQEVEIYSYTHSIVFTVKMRDMSPIEPMSSSLKKLLNRL